ncbi:MAG: NAD(P)-dependent oxidoreductase [Chloroflexi bacterium]|nr:NAD(P)-dependent oxidoreductase [Chloroflexota bacterium]
MTERIGFIGMGLMGVPMGKNLADAGYPLTVWNRTPGRAKILLDAGAAEGTSPSDVASRSDIIITMVSDSEDVAAVIAGPNGIIEGVESGAMVIDMSTISPKTSIALAEQLKAKGVQLLDAPVTGGVAGAQAGTLSILVGGEKSAFDRALPVFEKMGANITHVGPSGAGHTTKLANQILAAGCMAGISEALVFAKKAGLDLDTWFKAVENGAGASWHLSNMAPKIIDGDFSAGYMVKHHQKDLRLIQETAGENAVAVPMTALVAQLYRAVQAEGGEEMGHQALVRAIERLAGIEARR